MAEDIFRFKEFSIQQKRSAHRIGTDGVVLGAMAYGLGGKPSRILDIGTGTGLVALMLAQRFPSAEIDGMELEANAYEEAVLNFENSPWGDRLFCYHASIEEFRTEIDEQYDLIVCNPPFFRASENNQKPTPRNLARNETFLPIRELAIAIDTLLSEGGTFWAVSPPDYMQDLENLLPDFSVVEKVQVKGSANSGVKRILAGFVKTNAVQSLKAKEKVAAQAFPVIRELILENSRHNYTEEFQKLTKDFYL